MSWPAPPQDAALHGPAGEFVCHTRPAHRIRITRPASGRSGTRRRHRGRHPQPLPVVDRTKVPHPRQRPGSPPLHKPRPHPSRPHPPSLHPRPEAHRLKAAPPNYVPPTAFASTVQFPSSFTCQRQQSPVLAARLHHRVNLNRHMSHATYRPVGGSPALPGRSLRLLRVLRHAPTATADGAPAPNPERVRRAPPGRFPRSLICRSAGSAPSCTPGASPRATATRLAASTDRTANGRPRRAPNRNRGPSTPNSP